MGGREKLMSGNVINNTSLNVEKGGDPSKFPLRINDRQGNLLSWIDDKGFSGGNLVQGVLTALPATKILWVDNNRTDSYTQSGSVIAPFKTIMGAVNQIIANADNPTYQYVIQINPGIYLETVDLSNPAINNITLLGYGVVLGPYAQ